MSEYEDDLASWRDDGLVRALQAPGSSDELAGEARYVAAFQAAHPSHSRPRRLRSVAGKLGTGGTAVVVTVALSSGVAAAAYTQNLPDSVQRVVHSVFGPIGAPGPMADGPALHRGAGSSTLPGATRSPSQDPTATPDTPTSTPTPGVTGGPTDAATGQPGGPSSSASPTDSPTTSATSAPTTAPTTGPTTPVPTAPPALEPAAMSIVGTGHRAGVGQTVTLSGVVAASDGTPVPDHRVVLVERGPSRWRPIAEGDTDSTGAVSLTSAPLTHSARFRLRTDRHVHSTVWRVGMVPDISATATPDGASVDITATVQGGQGGNRVRLLRRIDHQPVVVERGRLDASRTVRFRVEAPTHHDVTYALRLLATPRHTAASTRVSVAPLVPASVTITAPTRRVVIGETTVLSGVVRAADGTPLAGRSVALALQRPGSDRWRRVGVGTTDPNGSVSIVGPPMQQTLRFRLRAARVVSATLLVRVQPTLSASTSPDGPDVDILTTAQGGRTGDPVLLQRRIDHRLVIVARGSLASDGTVRFTVARPAARTLTYVVRLVATARHTSAVTKVPVAPGT
jgi:hypothetical protein